MSELAAAIGSCQGWSTNRYREGRYYKGDDAWFLSTLMGGTEGGRLVGVRWTEYLPRETRKEFAPGLGGGVPETGTDRAVDLTLANVRIEMELLDAADTILQTLQPGALNRLMPSWKYRARFRTPLPDPLNDPLLETPVLDDVSFLLQGASGPRILQWGAPG